MTAKEFLNKGYKIDRRINAKLEQQANLRELATKTGTVMSGMPGNPNKGKSRVEEIIVKIMMLEEEINTDIDEMVSLKMDITKAIGTVSDPEESLLLTLRYLNYKTWEEIADELNCSVRKVHIVHSKALSDVIVPKE
ncbi:MAG: DUF1492 domain-containing protein [Lachnospiraceae bacterium]|nr:DUF1492 domain-containing protein [Lachnospiraceae bacterium]